MDSKYEIRNFNLSLCIYMTVHRADGILNFATTAIHRLRVSAPSQPRIVASIVGKLETRLRILRIVSRTNRHTGQITRSLRIWV